MAKEIQQISQEEIAFMSETAQTDGGESFSLYVMGLLNPLRRGEYSCLEEIFEKAVREPGNEEHIGNWTLARNYLEEHADYYGITL